MAKKEMDNDLKQDKAMIKKAFREHDKQEHPGKHTKLVLKKGGAAKVYAKGGVVSSQEKELGRNLARVANQGSKK